MVDIKNSSGKIVGYVDIQDDKIIIYDYKKPELIINDLEIIYNIKNNNRENCFIQKLYDKFFLTIGEIAALYNVCYSNINKQTRSINFKTKKNENRRNSSYGQTFSKERCNNISKSLKEGYANGSIKPTYYERTPEIREKISQSLKKYFSENPEDPTPHIENWKKGKYDNVDFHIGIGGHFYSYKNNKEYRFRSLLELAYFLLLEKDETVKDYIYEPFKIECDNGRSYTPDLLINNKDLVEIKSKKYVENVKGVLEKVLYKKEQAEKYCKLHNLSYKIVYDTDINYESRKFKKYLRDNPKIVEYYKIKINQPERMVVK